MHFNLTNKHLFIRYVGDFNHPSDLNRIELWTDKISELVNLGIENIWFYIINLERTEKILFFYNKLIPNINKILNTKIPLLNNTVICS